MITQPKSSKKFKEPENDPDLIDYLGRIAKIITPNLFAGSQGFKFFLLKIPQSKLAKELSITSHRSSVNQDKRSLKANLKRLQNSQNGASEDLQTRPEYFLQVETFFCLDA